MLRVETSARCAAAWIVLAHMKTRIATRVCLYGIFLDHSAFAFFKHLSKSLINVARFGDGFLLPLFARPYAFKTKRDGLGLSVWPGCFSRLWWGLVHEWILHL